MGIAVTMTMLGGCAPAVRRTWHQTVVLIDANVRSGRAAATMETPVDLALTPMGDGRWRVCGPVVTTSTAPGFSEVLVSWNVAVEPGGAAAVEVRVGDREGWTPDLRVGCVGDRSMLNSLAAARSYVVDGISRGEIDTDYFKSGQSFDRVQMIVTVVAPAGWSAHVPPARVERLAVCMSAGMEGAGTACKGADAASSAFVKNAVPFRSQKTNIPVLSGRLCSPTSLAMVMAFHGVDRSVQDIAASAHDAENDIYGNWPRNVQAAFESGVPGFLTRFDDWEVVAEHLRRGEPIIASIRAPRGVLRNAPYLELESGHLIVLTGLNGHGGVYVNDPAAATAESGQRVYSIGELTKAWMELGKGTGYVLLGRGGK